MTFQVTVRLGDRYEYRTFTVEAGDVAVALRKAADALPPDVVESADLVEVRPAPEPEERRYLGEEEGG